MRTRAHIGGRARAAVRCWSRALMTGAALAAAGCLSIDQMAPPVGEDLLSVGAGGGHSPEVLQRGRRIYLTDCVDCHTVEPIDLYSVREWETILPDMADESGLGEADRRALRAYILTAWEAMRRRREAAEP